jgi:hypothetical protein
MATLRTGDYSLRGALVSSVLAIVSGCRGISDRAGPSGGPHHDLALGAALRARAQQALPPGIEADQRFLEGGRNLYLCGWEMAIPISSGRFHRCHIDFSLSVNRDAAAAKRFFQKALQSPRHPRPRVINVDGNPCYPKVITELKQERKLGRRCRCRTCPYLNNIVEQDHRAIKRRVNASQGFRSSVGAWRTIQGYEVMHMIRKGQVRWLAREDVLGQILFIGELLGLKAA